jgi:threonine dehydratase
VPVKLAEVDAVIETRNPRHVGEVTAALSAAGFPARLLSSMAMSSS